METELNYGNWIRIRILIILGLVTLGLGALIFLPFGSTYRLIMTAVFLVVTLSFLFPLYSYYAFSQNGGRFQDKLYHLIIQSLGDKLKGRILDIGSGNGVLAVKLAQRFTDAEVTGLDYWGDDWEYSKQVCDANAQIGGVATRVKFQKGDAGTMEFEHDTFDGVTSNLTFHEVKSVADKRKVLQEALRVVTPGGRFAFVDYFYEPKFYGQTSEFEQYLKNLNLSHFEYKPLKDLLDVPMLLRHPRILGRAGLIYGQK